MDMCSRSALQIEPHQKAAAGGNILWVLTGLTSMGILQDETHTAMMFSSTSEIRTQSWVGVRRLRKEWKSAACLWHMQRKATRQPQTNGSQQM